jgi:hypothetical protein
MRKHRRSATPPLDAALGYAADERGYGVAYARLTTPGGEHLLRVSFRLGRGQAGSEYQRVAGYAALTAIAGELRRRGVESATFTLEDAQLVEDVTTHRPVPAPIVLPYVRLRCALNTFDRYALQVGNGAGDLAARARAEVALNVAA